MPSAPCPRREGPLAGRGSSTVRIVGARRAAGRPTVAGIGFAVHNGVAVFRFRNIHVTGALAIGGTNAV
ncbi:MAG: hypothetical protein ABMA25_21700, partial [Ilumatobacteraceae bacterium]